MFPEHYLSPLHYQPMQTIDWCYSEKSSQAFEELKCFSRQAAIVRSAWPVPNNANNYSMITLK